MINSYLQWAGGKNKILKNLLPILKEYKKPTFVEPFVGAGNVSLNFEADNYILNDLNKDLINSHIKVIKNTENYIKICEDMFEAGYEFYYDYRETFNKLDTEDLTKACIFQYLNKHGFNGLCRYNSKGEYNVPIGTVKKKPNKVPTDKIKAFANKFSEDMFFSEHYSGFMDVPDSLIYCDPPYVPMGASNFKYTEKGFDYNEQEKLKTLAKNSKQVVIISNHWNEITKELYRDADHIEVFDVQRTISCKGHDRIKVKECVVVYEEYKDEQ